MRVVLAAVVLAVCAVSAQAQGAWRNFDGGAFDVKQGAAVCPIEDDETGNYYCFSVSCSQSGPLEFSLSVAGGDLPDEVQALIEVDGEVAATLPFTSIGATDAFVFTAPFDRAAHPALIERLKAGRRAAVVLIAGGLYLRQPMGLRGSSRTLDVVMQSCPLPPPPPVMRPQDQVIAEVRAVCDGEISTRPGFERREDLDGDGTLDLILDYGAVVCTGAPPLFCGSGGCSMGIYRGLPGGGYQPVGTPLVYGMQVEEIRVLRMEMHGSACGTFGAAGCTKRFLWQDGQLVPLE